MTSEKGKKRQLLSEKHFLNCYCHFLGSQKISALFLKKVSPALAPKCPMKVYRQLSWTQRYSRWNRRVLESVLKIQKKNEKCLSYFIRKKSQIVWAKIQNNHVLLFDRSGSISTLFSQPEPRKLEKSTLATCENIFSPFSRQHFGNEMLSAA